MRGWQILTEQPVGVGVGDSLPSAQPLPQQKPLLWRIAFTSDYPKFYTIFDGFWLLVDRFC
jgi:hypothetical protein